MDIQKAGTQVMGTLARQTPMQLDDDMLLVIIDAIMEALRMILDRCGPQPSLSDLARLAKTRTVRGWIYRGLIFDAVDRVRCRYAMLPYEWHACGGDHLAWAMIDAAEEIGYDETAQLFAEARVRVIGQRR